MSAPDPVPGDSAPIAPDSPLGRALAGYGVPDLPAGFAERVAAAAAARPQPSLPPLPELRRPPVAARGWRLGRRIAIATIGFGALASAAAATGLLERFDLPVPSPRQVWASISGSETTPAPPVAAVPPPADPAPSGLVRVPIEGPIDTPEELGEAFRRIDEVREGRIAERRARIEARIESAKEARRAAGLPVPTPEEEARIRARLDEARARREGLVSERIAAHREELRQRVEAGEAVTPQDIARPLRDDALTPERLERLRQMSPQQRRETLRQLPPEQRRELLEAWRRYRAERLRAGSPESPGPAAPEALGSEPPAQETPAPLSQPGTPPGEAPR